MVCVYVMDEQREFETCELDLLPVSLTVPATSWSYPRIIGRTTSGPGYYSRKVFLICCIFVPRSHMFQYACSISGNLHLHHRVKAELAASSR